MSKAKKLVKSVDIENNSFIIRSKKGGNTHEKNTYDKKSIRK